MRITVFGASGTIGQRIVREALARGHSVTAIARNPERVDASDERVTSVAGDVRDPSSVAQAVAGHDAVVCAIGPTGGQEPQVLSEAARSLITGVLRADVRRLLVVNGAGSLEVSPGTQLLDTPEFPPSWKPVATAHRDALEVYRGAPAELEWIVLSPAAFIAPGERTSTYRTGGDQLVTDAAGQSRISAEDYAVALLDEIETPRHLRQRFTVAY